MHTRPNWAEISLSTLAENYRVIARHLGPGVTPCCVTKCDAYGHGVIETARALEEAGALWLGVTSAEEGVAVREAGVKLPILVMIHTAYDRTFIPEFSHQVAAEFRNRKPEAEIRCLPCGHYTLGEFPYK